jgi:FlaA1/EpsC-like NDP-sugar epimerase
VIARVSCSRSSRNEAKSLVINVMQDDESIWTEFAGVSGCPASSLLSKEHISGKTLLITGAGGSIGSAFTRFAATCNPEALVLLDNSEHGLHALEQSFDLSSNVTRVPVLGSICDSALLSEVCALYHPQIILHAAACKHVPLMELNPLAAANTNVLGTYALLQAATEYGVGQFIMVSTDKAVLPASIMGASKRLAELLLFAHPKKALQRKAVRLGNVLGSSGSVGPLFFKQIREGGPVTVTHPQARRFFLTIDHAVALLVTALSPEYESGILIPDLGPARAIEELAHYLITNTAENQDVEITFTGLRPGDKLEELLFSPDEEAVVRNEGLFSRIPPEVLASRALRATVEQIAESVRQRDSRLLLESIREALPEYLPSPVLRQVIENSPRTAIER